MATNAFNTVHHHTIRRRRHSIDCPPFAAAAAAASFPLKSPAGGGEGRTLLSHSATFAVSPASTSTSPGAAADVVSLDALRQHLTSKNFRQADEETRRLLIALAGDAAVKRGYVFFSEVQFIAADDLRAIDALWREHSDGRFGYSVQKRIWQKLNRDFTKFFIRVGWMKKLEGSEVEQYNYRSFPAEFMWEMAEGTPEGHLPLTNALRGTQLLTSIFTHPAFDDCEEEPKEGTVVAEDRAKIELMGSKGFKTNYTF